MNPIWLPASLFGGLFQAWRTALQQRLRAELSVSGAGLVRYLYGLPFALVFAAIWLTIQHDAIPAFGTAFGGFAVAGAVTQMAGTILLIMAFGHRGFVVGTAFSKTEAVQAALVTALFLGERFGGHRPTAAAQTVDDRKEPPRLVHAILSPAASSARHKAGSAAAKGPAHRL